jgi:geranylgeranyl pyrophosphate synthase
MKKFKEKVLYINSYINIYLLEPLKKKNKTLHDLVSHAISGGKRLRSVITLVIGECLNPNININKLALAVELLHNASLILDDMPCMDNDTHRRGKETIHHKYGQQKAQLLVAYLLRKAFSLIHANYRELINWRKVESTRLRGEGLSLNESASCGGTQDDVAVLDDLETIIYDIYDNINQNMGYLGAATGQFIDICPINSRIDSSAYKKYYSSVEKLMDLIYLKTTTFFEVGFIPAYLICVPKSKRTSKNRDKMRRIVRYFGLAFQISDDYEDVQQDLDRVEKEYNPNLICKFGEEKAYGVYRDAITQFKTLSQDVGIYHCVFKELCDFLDNRVNKHRDILNTIDII